MSAAGDVNGDGFGDLLIGADGADPNGSASGASYVVFGQAGGFDANLNLSTLNGSNGFKINGEAAGDGSGISVSAAGDVNGDGVGDLIIGARDADPNGSQVRGELRASLARAWSVSRAPVGARRLRTSMATGSLSN